VSALAATYAAAAGDDKYTQAVQSAYNIVRDAPGGDVAAAEQAATTLAAGTGDSQPEILDDLNTRPPDFEDARARLSTLLRALQSPVDTSNPAGDQSAVGDVLKMHRYDALHQPPSLFDRFVNWLMDAITRLLSNIPFGAGLGAGRVLIVLAILALAVAIVLVLITRRAGGRRQPAQRHHEAPKASDIFAEADRLAAAGDHTLALRALCAGVAAALGGERTWDVSPLTVREIFSRAASPSSLRPLLAPFEAAYYGGRPVDRDTYATASIAADAYRPKEKAA
jgi:Na+-transporting methylmalonyl-CoA/oxaloacetate decarboxylase gamma subunit